MRLLLLLACVLAAGCGRSPTDAAERSGYRRVQRAYDGAPPVIPHAVRALQRQDCLSCHRDGLRLPDGTLAARTPHPDQVNCLQCHVEQLTRDDGLARNGFTGLRHAARGGRAYPGAPPTIPHPVDGRRHCLGCHDELGGSPIETPHPDRIQCAQCHVPMRPELAAWRANTFSDTGRP